ncbi:hypothetical protein DSOL_2501 [Desulfosporosinus metallidurans]|uniref:Uncharacterized protein n=1 Tax=Desulfosporosinus metallidurans TaxID=1888891 RepID=A0A1Q8QWB2_9FIRM|nr:hypothetical protein DSOL_2501 [Desulfosporosinus metallidurans]
MLEKKFDVRLDPDALMVKKYFILHRKLVLCGERIHVYQY